MGIPDDWSTLAIIGAMLAFVAMFAVAAFFFLRFLKTFKLVRSQLMPFGGKVAFWATLVYLFSPVDLLPDPILLDDIAVLAASLTYITNLAKGLGIGGAGEGDGGDQQDVIDVPWRE